MSAPSLMGRFRCLIDPSLGKGLDWDVPGLIYTFVNRAPAGGAERRPLTLINYVSENHFDPPKCRKRALVTLPNLF